jgi:hypothetical protein
MMACRFSYSSRVYFGVLRTLPSTKAFSGVEANRVSSFRAIVIRIALRVCQMVSENLVVLGEAMEVFCDVVMCRFVSPIGIVVTKAEIPRQHGRRRRMVKLFISEPCSSVIGSISGHGLHANKHCTASTSAHIGAVSGDIATI